MSPNSNPHSALVELLEKNTLVVPTNLSATKKLMEKYTQREDYHEVYKSLFKEFHKDSRPEIYDLFLHEDNLLHKCARVEKELRNEMKKREESYNKSLKYRCGELNYNDDKYYPGGGQKKSKLIRSRSKSMKKSKKKTMKFSKKRLTKKKKRTKKKSNK